MKLSTQNFSAFTRVLSPMPCGMWRCHKVRAHSLKVFSHGAGCPLKQGFTMVEIALSLAVIGFALVTIIGVLPLGMSVQKENREETIINQDAAYWMDAIRGGARGMDDLTNYVRGITITNIVTVINASGLAETTTTNLYIFTNFGPGFVPSSTSTLNGAPTTPQVPIDIGSNIIGLLTLPKYQHFHNFPKQGYLTSVTNRVVSYVQAISGSAAEKYPQTNEAIRELAFSYQMMTEIIPYFAFDHFATNHAVLPPGHPEYAIRSNYFHFVRNFQKNFHDIRLLFRWPYFPNGSLGRGRGGFRTQTSGMLTNLPTGIVPPSDCPPLEFHFFVPGTYVFAP